MHGVDAIDYATEHPPAEGRAHVRGDAIRRAPAAGRQLKCTWSSVVDAVNGARLDLSDPFTEHATWGAAPSESAVPDSLAPPAEPAAEGGDASSLWDHIVALRSHLRCGPRE